MQKHLLPACLAIFACVMLLASRAKADECLFTISDNGIASSGTFIANSEADVHVATSVTHLFDGDDNVRLTDSTDSDDPRVSFSVNRMKHNLFDLADRDDHDFAGVGDDSSEKMEKQGHDHDRDGDDDDHDGDHDRDHDGDHDHDHDDDHKSVTPEPTSVILLMSGLGVCLWAGRRLLRLPTTNQLS